MDGELLRVYNTLYSVVFLKKNYIKVGVLSNLLPFFSFMGKIPTQPASRMASNYDEVFMHQTLLFDDSLKDLKNLRTQLYSAAEYFELSYTNDDQKQVLVETLKDYAIKALINTVDHLGSVAYKVSDLLDEKVTNVLGEELRLSCIEQRIKTCQGFMDHEGHTQQALVISTPKHHKRYILPVGETLHGTKFTKSNYIGCNLDDEDDWHHFRNAVRASLRETPTSTASKENSPSPSLQPQRVGAFSFTSTSMAKKDLEKRTVSPHRFPLSRTGSMSSRSTTPKTSRSTTPNSSNRTTSPSNARLRQYPSEPRKSASMRLHSDINNSKDMEQHPSKSKRLLKALLSRRKSKKDDMLLTYLDEY
ncbi:protein ABIL2-like isoform X1 [Cicer arietinum]|uniref:Protein ABIL2-like isoform X1 n=3 Tax=Cicer arietinum TaxID=3827 RepID=A0A3Q7YEE6_CICAR|nr:protein ABIL2-like isoform X1 [Cicer arietinum]